MKKKRSVERDLVTLVILIAVAFSIISFVQDPIITGRTVEPTNQPPIWTFESTAFTTVKNEFLILNLDNYFTDPDGDELTYLASIASNIGIEISGQQIKLTPDADFTGERLIPIFASDGYDTLRQIVKLEILETLPEPVQSQTPAMPAVEQKIKDQTGRTVGKKVEEDYSFDTIITNVEKTQTDLIVQFHHNANNELPVRIEGEVNYHFSKQTALPEETITLTVKLVENGIVPKFKLHVGQTSDIFEFGKTIPEITITDEKEQVTGHYEIYDREDDYVDVELTKGESKAALNAVDAEEINAKIGEIKNINMKTEAIAIDPIDLGAATITLAKTGPVTAIRTCENFDVDTFKCKSSWEITEIPFIDEGDSITFTVDHFSAYVGGTSTNLTIWDDTDTGVRYINTQINFTANFTNSTGQPANTTNSTCFIRFNTGAGWGAFFNMTFNATGNDLFIYNRSFAAQGTPYWYEVNCTGSGDNLAVNDTIYVYQFPPPQGLFSCTFRTGIGCLAGETDVMGVSAVTNAHAELPTQANYATRICCADLSGRNTIRTNGSTVLNLSNATNAHVGLPNVGPPYNYPINLSGSNDTLTCNYTYTFGDCSGILNAGCMATISNATNGHVSDCANNPYNLTVCCVFARIPAPSFINITKRATSQAVIGTQLTYQIIYQNNMSGIAYNITINDTYPPGTNFVNASPAPNISNNVWLFSSLPALTQRTINITLLINCSVANGTVLNNTVNVSWYNETGAHLNNSVIANVTALLIPNITITKIDSQDPVINGTNFTYTITWVNQLCNASNVVINDTYPGPTVVYRNATLQPNSTGNFWLYWILGNITQGANGTINITVTANATTLPVTVTNNVTLTTGEGTNSTAQETTTINPVPTPAPTAGGGWAAAEGARQYYQRQAQEAAEEQKELKCTEKWNCGEWSDCIDGQKTRTCTDTNACGTANFKPGETTPCTTEQPAAKPIGKAVQKPQLPPKPAAIPEQPAQRTSTLATMMPFATYGIIAVLIIVLLVYLITEHFIGKKTHAAWTYILYALLAISIIAAALDYFINKDPLWPAVFAIAAIIIVFLLDMLLSWLAMPPKTQGPPLNTEIPPIRPKKSEIDKDQVKELAKKLKELKF